MPISFDHQAYLGDRVELIAAEKAGIIKKGCPVVIGRQEFDAAEDVLVDTAERMGCPTAVYGQDYSAHEESAGLSIRMSSALRIFPCHVFPVATSFPMPLPPSARSRLLALR